MTEINGLLQLRPLWFRSTLTKRGIFLLGARLSLLIITLSNIHVVTTSIGIMESKFPRLEYPRSNNTTADHCGPMKEYHLTTGMIMRIEMH